MTGRNCLFACATLFSFQLACGDAFFEDAESEPLLFVDAVDPPNTAAPTTILDPNGDEFRPVHATLMPDGRVMFASTGSDSIAGALTPTPAYQPSPPTVTLSAEVLPLDIPAGIYGEYYAADTLFCGGQTLLADGTVFFAGGTRAVSNLTTGEWAMYGMPYATTYKDGTWTRVANEMVGTGDQGINYRWYPAATRLRDGRVLVTSGRDLVLYSGPGGSQQVGTKNRSTEIYDPATGDWSLVADHASTPDEIYNPDYTHLFVLPYDTDFDTIALGGAGIPHFLSETLAPHWFSSNVMRPGTAVDESGNRLEDPNVGSSTLMLPIRITNGEFGYFNGSVFVAGGTYNRPHEMSYDVYDIFAGSWLQRNSMASRRHHPSSIILPDATILLLAGHDDVDGSPLVRHASIINPRTGFTRDDGITDLGENRGYHTVSVLLPDGRVLLAGGRSAGAGGPVDEKPNMRYYYPPYMFRTRPLLTSAPPVIGYGQEVTISWTGGNLSEAVLVGLGSMTHSVDLNQRYVQLEVVNVDQTAKTATLRGPDGGWTAPPGHYMLFMLDEALTPSYAPIIKVE